MEEPSTPPENSSPWASPGHSAPPEQARPDQYRAPGYGPGGASYGPPGPRYQAHAPHHTTPEQPAGAIHGAYTFPSLTKARFEPLAAVSLATSPISPVGLGTGIVALRRIKKGTLRGRGVAITGVLLSSLFLIASVLAVATLALDGTWARMLETPTAGDVPATRTGSPVNLDVGNCVATLPVTTEVGEVTLTPCSDEHRLQVIDRLGVDGEAYPGPEALFDRARQACSASLDALTTGGDGPSSSYEPWHLVPSEDNWSAGERNIICFARSTSGPVTSDVIGG